MKTKPWMMLVAMFAGWLNQQQQEAIEYLKEENKILGLVEVCQRNDNQLPNSCFGYYCG